MESTKHAPAERAGTEEIQASFQNLKSLDYIQEIINALPFIAVILNKERQIVFANNTKIKSLGLANITEILGTRPGELLQCIHATDEPGGCGTSEHCKFCGAVNTVLSCQETKSKAMDECRIESKVNNEPIHYDFKVTATPFYWLNKEYTILTLVDISDTKRRNALERIFFHDILNKTGSLSGFLEIIRRTDDFTKIKELTVLMEGIAHDLNDEIMAQRQLLSAENNNLTISISDIQTDELVRSVVQQMKHHQVAFNREVAMDEDTCSQNLKTDIVLLKRVLINMIKNALEASKDGAIIMVGCHKKPGQVAFWVHNPSYMSDEVQHQIFQRSFSTKGINRGLGTYSMKLLGEKYLKGKVSFTTDIEDGTVFYITIPTKV